ncbi:DUF4271 domain-containing protein [Adhaeribacter terrigena]|uniref:DUF4271 domain-containing protein n=1 Tax=Adhaeribacter terrigena TaxID=2793070 RepID=UPI00293D6668|nr:DUF4271 domain-containing protein [Adhaeribacter terrigena]
MRRPLLLNKVAGWLLTALLAFKVILPVQAQTPDRKPVAVTSTNTLSSDWLVYEGSKKQLVPFVPADNAGKRAFYQWVRLRPGYPFEITFPASRGLSLFLDNRLIFKADSTANYTINLTGIISLPAQEKKYLLAVWSPDVLPKLSDFKNLSEEESLNALAGATAEPIKNKPRATLNQNAFILFLLLIGLIYGSLRTSFSTDFNSVFRVGNLFRQTSLEEGFLAKPISSWSSILFVVAFSLSFALLIVAIHTNIQNSFIFNRIFWVSESDITSRIAYYAIIIFGFIFLKFLFLQLMGYIFDLSALVLTQYREFLRSILFMGVFLPFVMLLYLAFNATHSDTVLLISTLAVSTLLIVTTLRIVYTLNKKASLRNLHLFSYICATEIIPLSVMLKLIIFNYA